MRAGSAVHASAEINRMMGSKRLVASVNVEVSVVDGEGGMPMESGDKIDKGSRKQRSKTTCTEPYENIISLPNGCSLQLPPGTFAAFAESFTGGVVTSLSIGPLLACPLYNIRVSISSFQVPDEKATMAPVSLRLAVSQAVDNALQTARHLQDGQKSDLILLEPLMRVVVIAPQHVIGAVVSDLGSRRRGTIVEIVAGDGLLIGSDSESSESQVIADVPIVHLIGYASSLRSMTGGNASFTALFHKYSVVPDDDADRILGIVNR